MSPMGEVPTLPDQAADLIEQLRTHREMIRLPASGPYHGSPFSTAWGGTQLEGVRPTGAVMQHPTVSRDRRRAQSTSRMLLLS